MPQFLYLDYYLVDPEWKLFIKFVHIARNNHFSVDCGDDWCPPPDFTSDILPIVYRNLDDEEKVKLENGALVDSGKVFIISQKYLYIKLLKSTEN